VEVTEVDAVAEVNWLTITEAAGDRRVHPDSAERKRQELQGKK
jgi:hypothetical protein